MYRTSAILYELMSLEGPIVRRCSFALNSLKMPGYKNRDQQKFSNNCRYYFTTAKCLKVKETSRLDAQIKETLQKIELAAESQQVSACSLVLKFLRSWCRHSEVRPGSRLVDLLASYLLSFVNPSGSDQLQNEGSIGPLSIPGAHYDQISNSQHNSIQTRAILQKLSQQALGPDHHEPDAGELQLSRRSSGFQAVEKESNFRVVKNNENEETPAKEERKQNLGFPAQNHAKSGQHPASRDHSAKPQVQQSTEFQKKGTKHQMKAKHGDPLDDERKLADTSKAANKCETERFRASMRRLIQMIDSNKLSEQQQESLLQGMKMSIVANIVRCSFEASKNESLTELLVCCGDSRGQTSMAKLFL